MMRKYNYIVVCRDNEIYDYAYSDLNRNNYSYFDNHFPYTKLSKRLCSLSYSGRVNRLIKHTGKHFWVKKRIKKYKKVSESFADKQLPVCFILFSDCLDLEKYGLTEKLRKNFANCKIVYFFQDLVSKDKNKKEFLLNHRNIADAIISFDCKDAEEYGLFFYNIPYSTPVQLESGKNVFDICFVGLAKDRISEIFLAYEYLSGKGLKCDFHIVGAKENEKKYIDKIEYCEPMSYYKYLNVLNQSKCILEILQKGGTGNTIRVDEAIAYDKYLITNNEYLNNNSFYYADYMKSYNSITELELDFLKFDKNVIYPDDIKSKISPNELIKFIEDKILKDSEKV